MFTRLIFFDYGVANNIAQKWFHPITPFRPSDILDVWSRPILLLTNSCREIQSTVCLAWLHSYKDYLWIEIVHFMSVSTKDDHPIKPNTTRLTLTFNIRSTLPFHCKCVLLLHVKRVLIMSVLHLWY